MSTTLFSQCLWLKYWQIISTWNFFMLFNVKDSLDQIWAYAHAVLLKKTVFPAWVGIEVVIYYIRVMYKNFQYSCELANFVLLSLYVFCWSVMWSLLKMYVLGHWKEGKKTIRWQEKQPGSTPCFSVHPQHKNIHAREGPHIPHQAAGFLPSDLTAFFSVDCQACSCKQQGYVCSRAILRSEGCSQCSV